MRLLSGLEFAELVWGRPNGRHIMAVIRAAFDGSQDHPCGVTTIAGYIGSADDWLTIDDPWNAQLVLAGIDHFHLKEIKKRFGDRWLQIVDGFAGVVHGKNLRSVTVSLKDEDWAKLDHDPVYRKLCPSREHACLDMLWGILAEEQKLQFGNEPVTVVFDNDWGGTLSAIVRNYEAWQASSQHRGFNLFLKGDVSWDCVPLQAADMAAGLERLNPFSRLRLDAKTEGYEMSELQRVAFRALGTGRGRMWSQALADMLDRFDAMAAELKNKPDSLGV